METISNTSYCSECGQEFPVFTETSEHEIYIRRYVGGKGHLIELALHKQCLIQRLRVEDMLNGIFSRVSPTAGKRSD